MNNRAVKACALIVFFSAPAMVFFQNCSKSNFNSDTQSSNSANPTISLNVSFAGSKSYYSTKYGSSYFANSFIDALKDKDGNIKFAPQPRLVSDPLIVSAAAVAKPVSQDNSNNQQSPEVYIKGEVPVLNCSQSAVCGQSINCSVQISKDQKIIPTFEYHAVASPISGYGGSGSGLLCAFSGCSGSSAGYKAGVYSFSIPNTDHFEAEVDYQIVVKDLNGTSNKVQYKMGKCTPPATPELVSFSYNEGTRELSFSTRNEANSAYFMVESFSSSTVLQCYNYGSRSGSPHCLNTSLVSSQNGVSNYKVSATEFLHQNYIKDGVTVYMSGYPKQSNSISILKNSAAASVWPQMECDKKVVKCGESLSCTAKVSTPNPVAWGRDLTHNKTDTGPLISFVGWKKINAGYYIYDSGPLYFSQGIDYRFSISDENRSSNDVPVKIEACAD